MMSDGDEKPAATLPTSTVEFNKKLDANIADGESLEKSELEAGWVRRRLSTLASSLKKWVGLE